METGHLSGRRQRFGVEKRRQFVIGIGKSCITIKLILKSEGFSTLFSVKLFRQCRTMRIVNGVDYEFDVGISYPASKNT